MHVLKFVMYVITLKKKFLVEGGRTRDNSAPLANVVTTDDVTSVDVNDDVRACIHMHSK